MNIVWKYKQAAVELTSVFSSRVNCAAELLTELCLPVGKSPASTLILLGSAFFKASWNCFQATGKLVGIKGEDTFKVTAGERRNEFIMEMEGEFEAG
jgi:hypothetical protein